MTLTDGVPRMPEWIIVDSTTLRMGLAAMLVLLVVVLLLATTRAGDDHE